MRDSNQGLKDNEQSDAAKTQKELNNKMKPQTYRLFAQLCESIVQEATTLSTILGNDPAANKLISALHKDVDLAHDQKYQQVPSISWSTINDTRYGAWVIIKFANGVGAIKALNQKSRYVALAVPNESLEVSIKKFSRGGDALNFFKQAGLGRLQQVYVGRDTGDRGEKRGVRQQTKFERERLSIPNTDSLTRKFKPLWAKAIQAAIADVKGMAMTMLQNEAFDKLEQKLHRLGTLRKLLDDIESNQISGQTMGGIRNLVNNAVVLTAVHYYPDEVQILVPRAARSRYGYVSNSGDSITKVFQDIANGDQKKLGMILGFFKRQLISG